MKTLVSVTLAVRLRRRRRKSSRARSAGRRLRPSMRPAAARFAALALKCLHQEYPNHISHTLSSDADAKPPRELTPAFYGCYDWHSDVHAHWLLVRLTRLFPDADFARRGARRRGAKPDGREHRRRSWLICGTRIGPPSSGPTGSPGFSRCARSCAAGTTPRPRNGRTTSKPLESEAATRLENWAGKLRYPIRVGEHDQTAFAFSLVWDWAGVASDLKCEASSHMPRGGSIYQDRDCPLGYEPSGEDFSRLVSGRRISCAACSAPRSSRAGCRISCRAFPRRLRQPVARARGRHRSGRSEACAHRWTESEPRMDARRNCRRVARARTGAWPALRAAAQLHRDAAFPA